MKKTLLALMLVSSLFVISCGADATKPQDAYKSQKTEIETGTKTVSITASGTTVDVSTFALPGEKVTEIVEATVDNAVVKTPTSAKNPDGGIYQFTVTGTAVTSVTYKYTKSAIAPIEEKQGVTATVTTGGGMSDSTATVYDDTFSFLFKIISVVNDQGTDITDYIKSISGNTITFNDKNLTGNITIQYQYMNVYQISEKPTKESAIETGSVITLTQNDAGKTYVCKDVTANRYYYGIVPATGKITLSSAPQNNNYQLWLY